MTRLLVLGCTVCYGDPASPLSKGAIAGVLVLLVAIGSLLVGFAGLFLFWIRRARALDAAEAEAARLLEASPARAAGLPATRT